jgi:diguanylate cyclase (GGDEF)-like protein
MLVALLIAGLASIPYYAVARLDAQARQRQETLVERNIALWITDVEFSLTAWTIWDEAIAKLDTAFDFEWTERNIGASLIGTSRTRFTAVLDASDRMIYSKTDERVGGRPFFLRGPEVIALEASPLVGKVREKQPDMAHPGIPTPISFSRIDVLGDEAVLLTASLFQPDFRTSVPKGANAPVLITAMPISGSLQKFFGSRFLLDDPEIGPLASVAANRARAEIAVDAQGKAVVLSWRSPTAAADLLDQALPLIVTVVVVLMGSGFLAVRMSRKTIAVLVDDEKRMRHAATHDFLTGLANRSLLEPTFASLTVNGPLTVVCIDLDGFKAVNDIHGHDTGDALLSVVASRLRSGTRQEDVVFRLGGDEFAILMPETLLDEAERICQRLSLALRAKVILPECSIAIGASFGLSAAIEGQATCGSALKAADEALYAAKANGRGSVVVALQAPKAMSAPFEHNRAAVRG